MDFALFMEKYGYKILLAVIFIGIFGLIGYVMFGLLKMISGLGVLGLGAGLALLIAMRMLIAGRYYEAYGEAMGKYFYDNRRKN
ncbi:hypothetical protein [Pyrococcus horikoshii]|uniref:Uncharacterized protein n=1 Tax=Pyrococcus horikoshii TaxID=53953 RepID=A0A832WJF5_PYRHR|nr:hypothetical protein [Pyrococcus horikoshii]HII60289.1 hypothetical protein [Pyrococcus horikoshii]